MTQQSHFTPPSQTTITNLDFPLFVAFKRWLVCTTEHTVTSFHISLIPVWADGEITY